jgi:putative DNA primase/helicase
VECAESETWTGDQRVDIASLASIRNQLWAEAVHRYRAGERWHLDTCELQSAQADAADERRVVDPRERKISIFISGLTAVRMDEILGPECLNIPIERWNRSLETEIGFVMSALGWRNKRVWIGKRREWIYVPKA